jgi:hypothetical protein
MVLMRVLMEFLNKLKDIPMKAIPDLVDYFQPACPPARLVLP